MEACIQSSPATTTKTSTSKNLFEDLNLELDLNLNLNLDSGSELNNPTSPKNKKSENISPDSFSFYLKAISAYNLLTNKEEKELITAFHSDDAKISKEAEEKLILCNLRLVISLARQYTRYGCPIEDLVAEGNLGLKTAISKYDPEKGAKLSTYSIPWIKQHLRKATNDSTRTIRIPAYQQKTVRKIHAVANKLSEITGQYPSDDEIAEEMGIKPSLVQNLRNLTVPMLSLQNPIGSGANQENKTYEDILSDQSGNGETPLERLSKKNNIEGIINLVNTRLSKKEQEVIKLRFGLTENCCKTLEEVGEVLNLTRERIRQIQEQALKKLRRSIEARESHEPTLLTFLTA